MTESNKEGRLILNLEELNQDDHALIEAAVQVLKTNYHPIRHQVGCAIRASSGNVYSAVNVESSGYGPHAEAIALGSAISNGEKNIISIVTVKKIEDKYPILSPCGNCRQLFFDYAHEAIVIFNYKGIPVKAKASDLLPGPYENSFTASIRDSGLNLLQ